MSYEHVDINGMKLKVQARDNYGVDCVEIGSHTDDGTFWRSIPICDAPAVALAILDAAGIEYVTIAEACNPAIYIAPERLALTRLQEWKRLHGRRVEEDVKVQAYRLHQHKAQGDNAPDKLDAWDILPEPERNSWRVEYRSARKFFEEQS